jgi:hypothetical protein
MARLAIYLIPLLFQLSLKVQAIPPESGIHAGQAFTIPMMITLDEPGFWPLKIRPVFNPPEGLELLGISARSGSGSAAPVPGGESLQYTITVLAREAGKYELAGIGVYYLDGASGQEREARADPINLEIVTSGIFGIEYKWVGLLVLLLGSGIGLAVWLMGRGGNPEETPAPTPLPGDWFRQSLEEIRRFRIRGEDVQCLQKIAEIEKMFPEPDPGLIAGLEDKVNHLKYGGQRISPAELEEIYRRTELKIKSLYPQEEQEDERSKVKGEGSKDKDYL